MHVIVLIFQQILKCKVIDCLIYVPINLDL